MILKRIIWLLIGVGASVTVWAQQPGSNLRKKMIAVQKAPAVLDSLSLVPNTVFIPGIPDSTYSVDYINATLTWNQFPVIDSVLVTYRVFPGRLNAAKQRMKFDSVMNNFIVQPITFNNNSESASSVFDFGTVTYNGSFGRSLAFGNRQDAVINSSLNLQLNGYLGDSIQIAAAITDNNIPIQPDGNTQNLNEFDQVFIQFSKNKWRFNIGDIDIRQNQSYFLNFYKRLQGGSFENENAIGKGITNKVLVSGAVAKGKFQRNIFQGGEGNQGPYRLTGANNEFFFIVLAGTERVFLDGELLQRGEDQDYVINYNTAEITFTPRRMITKDKRIQIEFEYADRNYLNAQLYLSDEVNFNNKFKLRISAFQNNDAKNSPINQTLDEKQKQFLADIGDSVKKAFYPSAALDTFSAGKILYAKIDTLYNGGSRDSIFIYSTNPNEAKFSLSFVDAGFGNADYILDVNAAANGKVFKWVAPDSNGNKRGQYAPAILLIAPRKQQLISLGADYFVNENTSIKSELAWSKFDVNTFSKRDKGNDDGIAGRIMFSNVKKINSNTGLQLLTDIGYEHVQSSFRPLERLRNVEFLRDWGLPFDATPATENILSAGIGLKDKRSNLFQYKVGSYARSNNYNAVRNAISHQADVAGWKLNNQFSYTSISQDFQKGYFLRPVIDISRQLKRWGNYNIGTNYSLEQTQLKYKQFDSLNRSSFAFDVFKLYLRSPDNLSNRWGITYFTRSDKYPSKNELVRTDRSQNINFYTELMKNESHQFRFNATYRKLNIINDKLTNLKPEETILGRAEYFLNEWKGGITGNVLYELGTGQEQRRDFSYLEVPAGQGQYTWIDYNNDGIQQLNEFELAQFQDQAKYIRVFTPTNEFVKASYLQFNYSITFNPRSAINLAAAKGFTKFLSRLYLQSSLQVNKKGLTGTRFAYFNPFLNSINDTSLLTLDQLLSNTFSFNRFSTDWGIDLNNIRSSGRSFLSYGYETRTLKDWNMKARINFARLYTFDVIVKKTLNQLITPKFNNRNYKIDGVSLEPRLTFTKGTNFRAQVGYKFDDRKNTGGEKSTNNSLNTEMKYNVVSNTSLTTKFTYSQIKFNAQPNSTVSYIMLDGLLPGKNFLWNADLTKRLTNFLELSFQYEGRKAGTSGVVHIGRAQLRALF